MNNLKRCEQLKEEEYQGIFGVTKATFDKMLLILEEAYKTAIQGSINLWKH